MPHGLASRTVARAALLAGAAALAMGGGRSVVEAQGTPPSPPPRFGLAHVDVMDLHVSRTAEGGTRPGEVLSAADLSDRFAKAAAARTGWDRWSMYWDLIEPRTGVLDWSVTDRMVARDRAAGMRTLVILQGTPGHSATPKVGGAPWLFDAAAPTTGRGLRPRRLMAEVPRGLTAPIFRYADGGSGDDPARAIAVGVDNPWAVFVASAVERYRPGGELARRERWSPGEGVRAWEIGNEPNLPFFWSGTAADYARYLEVAYLTVQFVDPGATVLHGGIADTGDAGAWYRRFLAALDARAAQTPLVARYGGYFDAAAWHWYTYPRQLSEGPAAVRALLAEHGLRKPIWVTEMGVPVWNEHPGPCWDPRSPHRATADEQSAFLWQSFAEGIAADVAVMIVFQAYDDCGNGPSSYDAFGLVRNHAGNQCWEPSPQPCWRRDPALSGVPRPAYGSFAAAGRELAGAELLWRPPAADGWQRILYYRPPSERVMVLWNTAREPRTVDVFATGPAGTLLAPGADGAITARPITAAGGRYALTLPGATNRNTPGNGAAAMAGHPVMVVERDTAAPFRAEVAPLPDTSPKDFELKVRAADGGTGVAAYQIWVATTDPAAGGAWSPWGDERPWPASPLSGEVAVAFSGAPGARFWLAARARDRAGNLSPLPTTAQATTRIEGAGPIAMPSPITVVARAYLPAALAVPPEASDRTAGPAANRSSPSNDRGSR